MTLAIAPVTATTETVLPAVLRTLVYADVFDYALTLTEIHRYLIGKAATPDSVGDTVEAACRAGEVTTAGAFFCLPGRRETMALRVERESYSAQVWPHARRWVDVITSLPFVRAVTVTGALAMNNVHTPHDDIDLLIITAPRRVWLARALCIGVVRVARRFSVELCPNYVLSSTALAQSQRNLYIAHELAQMVPLAGHTLYAEICAANRWTRSFLPNATAPQSASQAQIPFAPALWRARPMRALQALGEPLLSNAVGDRLERWERDRKQRKFARAVTHSAAAQLDLDHVKGHFHDHGVRVLQTYETRLAQFSIDLHR
ncbi:MAG: hypothetical protein ACT4QE_20125 [Anaerolineales bacterium]